MSDFEDDLPALCRRQMLRGVVGASIVGAGVSASGTAAGAQTEITVKQGSQTYTVTPLSYRNWTVQEFYSYGDPDRASANTPTDIEAADRSRLFLYEGPNGLSLVAIHDDVWSGDGGQARFEFTDLPTEDGSWVVQDDPGETSYGSTLEWGWVRCCTDGGAFRGGLDGQTVRLNASFSGIEEWQLLSGSASDPDVFTLDLSTELVINADTAPSVSADTGSVTVAEGETATNTGTFSDPDGDTVSLSASVGTVTKGDGTWEWSYATTDGPDDSTTVTITATDSSGESNTASFDLTVTNVAPTVTVDAGSVAVTEGETATNAGSYADPGDDTVSLSASVGSVSAASGSWGWEFTPTDGPGQSQSVTIAATDGDAETAVSFDLQVSNARPTVAVDNGTVTAKEGETATNTGSFADPGDDTVALSASVGSVTKGDGTWEWSYDVADVADSGTVTITATDDDGASSDVSFDLTVTNPAPSLTVDSTSVSVVEGETATNAGDVTDPDGDDVSLNASVGTVSETSDGWNWSYPTTDGPDDGGTVTVTATDSDGATDEVSLDLKVDNAAPSVSVDAGSVSVTEGETATNTGSFADPGDDTVSLRADRGTVSKNGGTWEWSYATSDGPADSGTVTVTAEDSDGATSAVGFDLKVDNAAPSVAADDGSVTVQEGETATNTGSFADPGDDTVSLSASVGSVSKGDGTWEWAYETTDGPADSGTVTVTAEDDDGATSTVDFDLTVSNVAPSVSVDERSVTVSEGETATNAGSFADPGDDTVSLSASVGSVTKDASGSWTWSYETTDGPEQSTTVTITAEDSDGATSSTDFDLTVSNVAPSVTASLPDEGRSGESTTLSASFKDPGTADTHTATVDWGDGTSEQLSVDQSANSISASHTYRSGGSYTVELTVTDDDGGTARVSKSIVVAYVVEMDVKPGNGDETDPVNPRSNGPIPVGIFTTDTFDASMVDVSTLLFGAPESVEEGTGATPVHDGHREDLDGDGHEDLLVHFGGDTGLGTGDDTAKVVGRTTDGIPIVGTDAIRVVGGNDNGGKAKGSNGTGGNGNSDSGGNGNGKGKGK